MPPTLPTNPAPSSLTWLGIARELTLGTPVLPVATVPLDKNSYSPEDTPKFLPDEAIRGTMGALFGEILGVEDATFSFGGPAFMDTIGWWLDNAFGDLSTTGSTPTNPTTLSAGTTAGATSCTVASATGYTNGAVVQIGTGATSETVILSSAPAGSTLTFTGYPLRFAHLSTEAVATVTGPYTHKFALLNSGTGQPPTHTVTDRTGLTPTVGARSYPFACVSQIDLTGNAEQLLMAKMAGNSWISAPAASAPVNTTTFTPPLAAWQSTVSVGGSQVFDVGEWTWTLKRTLQLYYTAQNSQLPYIARGGLLMNGGINFTIPSDESPLTLMLGNTQPAVTFTLDNGQAGTAHQSIAVTMSQAAFVKSKPDRNAVLVGYQDEYNAVDNITDVGGSGGLGAGTVTLINNVAAY